LGQRRSRSILSLGGVGRETCARRATAASLDKVDTLSAVDLATSIPSFASSAPILEESHDGLAFRIRPMSALRRFLSNLIPSCLSFRPASVSRQQLHSPTMRLLSLLEPERKYGAIRYEILRQSPKLRRNWRPARTGRSTEGTPVFTESLLLPCLNRSRLDKEQHAPAAQPPLLATPRIRGRNHRVAAVHCRRGDFSGSLLGLDEYLPDRLPSSLVVVGYSQNLLHLNSATALIVILTRYSPPAPATTSMLRGPG